MKFHKTIKYVAIAALASCSLTTLAADTQASRMKPTSPQLSVQLWSVKDDVAADFEGTLTKIAAMGFQGVEFAGNFGKYANDAKGLKKFLEKTGLKASGAHVPFEKLNAEHFEATVAFYKAIDCYYLIIPMDHRAQTAEGAKAVAKDLADLEKKLKPHGMYIGYHNHKIEMMGETGKTPWDVIGTGTVDAVILQQDVGWTEVAGKDPLDFIRAYPGRTITTHYKAAAPEPGNKEHPIIGQDSTDWKALVETNKAIGGTLWLVVEQEVYPEGMTPMQSIEASLRGLKKVMADVK